MKAGLSLILTMLFLVGCGSANVSPRSAAAEAARAGRSAYAAAEAYLKAAKAGDGGLACDLMSPRERRRLNQTGGCAVIVKTDGPSLVHAGGQISQISYNGAIATATVFVPGKYGSPSEHQSIVVQRLNGKWSVRDSGLQER